MRTARLQAVVLEEQGGLPGRTRPRPAPIVLAMPRRSSLNGGLRRGASGPLFCVRSDPELAFLLHFTLSQRLRSCPKIDLSGQATSAPAPVAAETGAGPKRMWLAIISRVTAPHLRGMILPPLAALNSLRTTAGNVAISRSVVLYSNWASGVGLRNVSRAAEGSRLIGALYFNRAL